VWRFSLCCSARRSVNHGLADIAEEIRKRRHAHATRRRLRVRGMRAGSESLRKDTQRSVVGER
jgi:hypothetical protein